MAYTIQQARLVQVVSEKLVAQRRATRAQCQSIKSEMDAYSVPQMALDKSQAFATNLGAFLDRLQTNQAEILTASDLVGVSDFVARWEELDDARTALNSATTGNIGARLQAIIDALPEETLI